MRFTQRRTFVRFSERGGDRSAGLPVSSPAAIRAVGGRSETARYAQSPAELIFASPPHPGSAAYASFLSARNE